MWPSSNHQQSLICRLAGKLWRMSEVSTNSALKARSEPRGNDGAETLDASGKMDYIGLVVDLKSSTQKRNVLPTTKAVNLLF